jgi:hypothetical protein
MGNWPCDFARKIFFFKEVYADQEVIVSLEISGSSEDASIYQFTTNSIYQTVHIVQLPKQRSLD